MANIRKTTASFKQEVSLLNPNMKVIGEYANAKTKIDIEYIECGHTYAFRPTNILSGVGTKCPICSGRNMNKTPKYFREEINKMFNGEIEVLTTYVSAKHPITIKYNKCGHTHETIPNNLISGHAIECLICNKKVHSRTGEEFALEVAKVAPDVLVDLTSYTRSVDKVSITYTSCGHTHSCVAGGLLQGINTTCRICSPSGTSKQEKELVTYIKSIYSGWVEENDRSILGGKELDIVLPDLGIAFEYNGTYWHSSAVQPSTYHQDKTNRVEEFGYQLIHILEWEWKYNTEVIKSRIRNLIGLSTRLFARGLVVKSLGYLTTGAFLDNNHIQGRGITTSKNYGLYAAEGDLVAVMTFATPRVPLESRIAEWELVRFCSKLNTTVVGGASKLLNAFVKECTPKSIMSYAARDWSRGTLYTMLGFIQVSTTRPGYTYYKGSNKYSRIKFQKHKLKELFPTAYSEDKTEFQIMEELGYLRVFDSGNLVFLKQYA